MVTVAHALVHGIRGTLGNRLFRLYVGQEWLSPAALSMEQKRKSKCCTEQRRSPRGLSAFNNLWFGTEGMNRLYGNSEQEIFDDRNQPRPMEQKSEG